MKLIAISRADGGVSVMSCNGVVADEVAKWQQSSAVAALSYREIESDFNFSSLDVDPYRDALKDAGVSLSHDMPKAREIHRKKMRDAREPKLAALDVEQLRGRNVEAQKQALRDVTSDPRIDAATTVEELKAAWPEILS